MTILIYIFIFIFGLIMGSFLNCLIWRLHTGESMMTRSHCPKCKGQISWYDNIPLFSYVFLFGKCRHCRECISVQYPAVEFVVGALFVVAFYNFGISNFQFSNNFPILQFPNFVNYILLIKSLFVISIMTIVFIYDLRWYMILDKVMIPSMVIVLVINSILGFMSGTLVYDLSMMLISGIIGGGFFLIQFVMSDGKWIGGGDIRLGFLMGLILSWPNILVALMLAYISGAFVGIGLILFGKKKLGSKLPFGVFLSTATLVAMFWSEYLIEWYFNLL